MQPHLQNHLLSSLPRQEFAFLEPHLKWAEMPIRTVLEGANKKIENVYFMTGGIASVVAKGPKDREIEVGIIGRDGMTGLCVLLGDGQSANTTFIQIAGSASSIRAEVLRDATETRLAMRSCFLRYVQAFTLQTAQTALANGRAKLDERLARWLLMSQDRVGSDQISLTHEFLALMLGVRRAGVTQTISALEKEGLIGGRRGAITIFDRDGLKKLAHGIYGIAEGEQRRLTGWKATS